MISADDIRDVVDGLGSYDGDKITLMGSQRIDQGADYGENVFIGAKSLGVFDRKTGKTIYSNADPTTAAILALLTAQQGGQQQ